MSQNTTAKSYECEGKLFERIDGANRKRNRAKSQSRVKDLLLFLHLSL